LKTAARAARQPEDRFRSAFDQAILWSVEKPTHPEKTPFSVHQTGTYFRMAHAWKRLLSLDLPQRQSAFLWGARKTGKSTLLQTAFPQSLTYDFLKTDLALSFGARPALLREQLPSRISASGAMPRPAGMGATVTPREAAVTRVKSPARTTPHGLPGRS